MTLKESKLVEANCNNLSGGKDNPSLTVSQQHQTLSFVIVVTEQLQKITESWSVIGPHLLRSTEQLGNL